jgi:plasmid stability protein
MLNLTLKNIPAELHLRLKTRAESNRRSLNREILALLEAQLEAPAVDVAAEQAQLERFVAALPHVDHTRVRRYRSFGRA